MSTTEDRPLRRMRTRWRTIFDPTVKRATRTRLVRAVLVGAVTNPLLASVAAAATLVLWVNVAVRGLLLIAAWVSNPPWANLPVAPTTVHSKERPNYVTLSAPHTLEWDHHPVTGALHPGPDDTDLGASRPARSR